MFDRLPPRPEYLEAVTKVLIEANGAEMGVQEIMKRSRLTKTQTVCTLDELFFSGKVTLRRQERTPKLMYSLSGGRTE